MRRVSVLVSLLPFILAGLVAAGAADDGQGHAATPAATAGHPAIGTWLIDWGGDPASPPGLVVLAADGTVVELLPDAPGRGDGAGAWAPTGPRTAAATVVFQLVDDAGTYGGVVKFRATIEVDGSGTRFTLPYAVEMIAPDGTARFAGQGTATATRVTVEAMATPLAGTRAP